MSSMEGPAVLGEMHDANDRSTSEASEEDRSPRSGKRRPGTCERRERAHIGGSGTPLAVTPLTERVRTPRSRQRCSPDHVLPVPCRDFPAAQVVVRGWHRPMSRSSTILLMRGNPGIQRPGLRFDEVSEFCDQGMPRHRAGSHPFVLHALEVGLVGLPSAAQPDVVEDREHSREQEVAELRGEHGRRTTGLGRLDLRYFY
jgi:hypothetical protein